MEMLKPKNSSNIKIQQGVSGKPGHETETHHLTNNMVKAQKQISSQETAGLIDQE
jgi:hypothetical protein